MRVQRRQTWVWPFQNSPMSQQQLTQQHQLHPRGVLLPCTAAVLAAMLAAAVAPACGVLGAAAAGMLRRAHQDIAGVQLPMERVELVSGRRRVVIAADAARAPTCRHGEVAIMLPCALTGSPTHSPACCNLPLTSVCTKLSCNNILRNVSRPRLTICSVMGGGGCTWD